MDKDRWNKLEEMFHAALELEDSERAEYLDKACGNDATLRQEIESLLVNDSNNDNSTLLKDSPPDEVAHLLKKKRVEFSISNWDCNELIGKVLDEKYRIEKKLGQGGMGAVYLATHIGTKRNVALKIIMPQFTTNPEFVERFKREAEATGRLHHPNVVNVTDFGFTKFNANNIAYLVMEYLDGKTLGDMLEENGKLSLEFVIDIVEQICLALDKAHKLGIIHRDLKPDNIWLEPDGRGGYNVKILDFGLAKLKDTRPAATSTVLAGAGSVNSMISILDEAKILMTQGDSGSRNSALDSELTKVGTILGTPLYMSPEQCMGEELEASSDIYSLGVIIYQMLAGETPFTGNLYSLMVKHCEMIPVPLREKRRDTPKVVASLIMQTLSKKPDERPKSAKAFATALRTTIYGELPILQQSFSLYKKHFFLFLKLSMRIFLPFSIINCFLMYTLIIHSPKEFPFTSLVQLLCWVIVLIIIFFSNSFHTTACSLALEQIFLKPQSPINYGKVIISLISRFRDISFTFIMSYKTIFLNSIKFIIPILRVHREYLFAPPVITLENFQGKFALDRSVILAKQFPTLLFSLQVRELITGIHTYLILFITYIIFINQNIWTKEFLIIIMLIFVPLIFQVLSHSLIAIPIIITYIKARESYGEPLSNVIEQHLDYLKVDKKIKYFNKRTIFFTIYLCLLSILALSTYVLIIQEDPIAKTNSLVAPPSIREEENAWTEYELASQALTFGNTDYKNRGDQIMWQQQNIRLSEYVDRTKEMDETIKIYISNSEAINHIIAGAKLNKAQFNGIYPYEYNNEPNFIEMRGLARLALAEARRLESIGKFKESLDLNLAIYKMGTDIAEKNSNKWSVVSAEFIRREAAKSLFYWLKNADMDADTYIMLSQRLNTLDKMMPNPYENYLWEWKYIERGIEGILIRGEEMDALTNPSSHIDNHYRLWISAIQLFPGLRTRTYNSFMKRISVLLEENRQDLENWNLTPVPQKKNHYEMEYWPPFIEDILASFLIEGLDTGTLGCIKPSYLDIVNGTFLQVFSICKAYKKIHGHYPNTLERAITEFGIISPIDLATGKAIGYRLENGNPIIWFAGVDGLDDGGLKSYQKYKFYYSTAGLDLVFNFENMPCTIW
jgi:serine/threonine protein kinase